MARGRLAGGASDVHHALHHRHRSDECKKRDNPKQQRAAVPGPENHRGGAQQDDALGPLRDAHPAGETEPPSATKQATSASVSRSGSTPPRRKNTPIPVNSADSPTRSSVESKKAPKGVLMPPSRATRPSTMSN